MRRCRYIAIAAIACAVVALAPGNGSEGPPASGSLAKEERRRPPRLTVIVVENHDYEEVVGNPEAPVFNALTRRGALFTRYHAIAHPSLPNYLAMIGGSTFGIRNSCTDCWASGPNLALQLSHAGISWRAYMEDMPEPCYAGASYGGRGGYVKRHNPFMYFPSIASVPSRCRNVVPTTELERDLGNGRLPTFSWITPNLCNDGHDCGLAAADRWLSETVPRITRKLGPGGILVLTFDEGSDTGGDTGGGRVVTVFLGPAARRGARITGRFDHYSLLATIEDRYGLPRVRNARGAPLMDRGIR